MLEGCTEKKLQCLHCQQRGTEAMTHRVCAFGRPLMCAWTAQSACLAVGAHMKPSHCLTRHHQQQDWQQRQRTSAFSFSDLSSSSMFSSRTLGSLYALGCISKPA